ncbi:MAG: polysaccharide deacetylase [Micavibrio aeruginosavorus]|uniref:Polysaccharide deacetylase n=1 Tax=Micavibrio aeruginosavorus TaxID=349221 RepID=A0A2W5PSW7_9BACT|nr:MAG: polysaccharide deacetylase [Micavibrio aeruginosavorus]
MFLRPIRLAALAFCAGLFMTAPAHALSMPADQSAAVIFAYFAVGNDDNPAGSLTTEQFTAQIDELTSGGYTVLPLADVIDAFNSGKPLPDRSVVLTFDGADKSVRDIALPLLEEHDLPFTVFIPADRVSAGAPPAMDWDDLRALKRSGHASFGIQSAAYSRLTGASDVEVKRQINSSIAAVRDELDVQPLFFAYPFGDYDDAYKNVIKSMGFKAAFGQQSGVASIKDDRYALPRFTLTETYGDIDRFIMAANALPLPVQDISPTDPHLHTLTPAIGFTVADDMSKYLKNLSCFSSSEEKPKLEILNSRVELRFSNPFDEDRPRINCTLPVPAVAGEDPRWRWFGVLYTVPQDLLQAAQSAKEKTSAQHDAADVSDSINIE